MTATDIKLNKTHNIMKNIMSKVKVKIIAKCLAVYTWVHIGTRVYTRHRIMSEKKNRGKVQSFADKVETHFEVELLSFV